LAQAGWEAVHDGRGQEIRMSTGTAARAELGSRLRRTAAAPFQGLVLALLAQLGIASFVFAANAIAFIVLGVGVLLAPVAIEVVRLKANLGRRLARDWSGVDIPEPYRPQPPLDRGIVGLLQRCRWLLRDPATWRDLLWLLVDATVGFALTLFPAALFFQGIFGLVQPVVWRPITAAGSDNWYLWLNVNSVAEARTAVPLGAALLLLGLLTGPWWIRQHGRLAGWLLTPTASATLARRVQRLTETRSDAVGTQAAELRRIERDLHDGAQARLVAMGMNLGAVEELLERDPTAARVLLAETREASAKALDELRNLVRGIHPPVLADRGLGDAVRALALDSPLQVDVTVTLAGRLEAPVESAGYFAVSELLTNIAKHAGARRVWVDLRHDGSRLRITVADDGHGGANAAGGTGLRGIERRLGTFDGTLALDSPPGGPTVVTMELPCVLSSPKTSSS
jgi:signal transduction histidine kinase